MIVVLMGMMMVRMAPYGLDSSSPGMRAVARHSPMGSFCARVARNLAAALAYRNGRLDEQRARPSRSRRCRPRRRRPGQDSRRRLGFFAEGFCSWPSRSATCICSVPERSPRRCRPNSCERKLKLSHRAPHRNAVGRRFPCVVAAGARMTATNSTDRWRRRPAPRARRRRPRRPGPAGGTATGS